MKIPSLRATNFFRITALGFGPFLLCACGGGGDSGGGTAQSAPASSNPTSAPSPTQSSDGETSFTQVAGISGMAFTVAPQGLFTSPEIPQIYPHGVAAGDYDNDGDTDLFIVKADQSANQLYQNQGNLVFEDVAVSAGLAFTNGATQTHRHGSPAFVDLNADGHLDVFIPGLENDPTMIFVSNRDGTFSDATAGSGFDQMSALYSHSPAFGDYDLDGDLDLFVAHWGTPRDFDNVGDTENLWRNDSDASGIRFTSVSLESGIAPGILTNSDPNISQRVFDHIFTPTFTRVNDDAWPDLLVVGDFNFSQVFINQGDGTFENQTDFDVIIDGNGMGSAVGDYDGDGDMDWFVSSILASDPDQNREIPATLSQIGNRLYRNNAGVFEDVTLSSGVADGGWGWGSCFIDFENDGDLDIYQTNGWPQPDFGGFSTDTSRAFVSDGEGQFVNQAEVLGLSDMDEGRGVVCDDFDNDGDVDILQLHRGSQNAVSLWRNNYQGTNDFLKVVLQGRAPNTQAVGARISVHIGNETYVRAVTLGSNFASHNSVVQHFGLGDVQSTARVVVEWPNGENSQVNGVVNNQTLIISQGN